MISACCKSSSFDRKTNITLVMVFPVITLKARRIQFPGSRCVYIYESTEEDRHSISLELILLKIYNEPSIVVYC